MTLRNRMRISSKELELLEVVNKLGSCSSENLHQKVSRCSGFETSYVETKDGRAENKKKFDRPLQQLKDILDDQIQQRFA